MQQSDPVPALKFRVCSSLPVLSYQSALELRGQVIPILALIETLPSSMCKN